MTTSFLSTGVDIDFGHTKNKLKKRKAANLSENGTRILTFLSKFV